MLVVATVTDVAHNAAFSVGCFRIHRATKTDSVLCLSLPDHDVMSPIFSYAARLTQILRALHAVQISRQYFALAGRIQRKTDDEIATGDLVSLPKMTAPDYHDFCRH